MTIRRWGSLRAGSKAAYHDGLGSFSMHTKLRFPKADLLRFASTDIKVVFLFLRAQRVPLMHRS